MSSSTQQALADQAYFAPLKQLHLPPSTQLYLGVVHHQDPDGTRRRIEAARQVVHDFGIATECGMGRRPSDQVQNVFDISAECSAPYA